MIVLQYMRLPRQRKEFSVCKPCVTHKICKDSRNCQVPLVNDQDKLTIGYKKGVQDETWVWNKEKGQEKREKEVVPNFKKVSKTKRGVPKKYLTGAKRPKAKESEIISTAKKYKRGEYIDIPSVVKSRMAQDGRKKTTKRKSKKSTKK